MAARKNGRNNSPAKPKNDTKNVVLRFRVGMSVIVTGLVLTMIIVWFGESGGAPASSSYNEQLQKLVQTGSNLTNLLRFLEEEKMRLKEGEIILASLKAEHEKLRPVVEADRRVAEAIFSIQEKRQATNAWFERSISFLLGILASILASLAIPLYGFIAKKLGRASASSANSRRSSARASCPPPEP